MTLGPLALMPPCRSLGLLDFCAAAACAATDVTPKLEISTCAKRKQDMSSNLQCHMPHLFHSDTIVLQGLAYYVERSTPTLLSTFVNDERQRTRSIEQAGLDDWW